MKERCFSLSLLIAMAIAIAFPAWNAIAEDVEGLVFYLSFDEEAGDPVDYSPDPTEVSIIGGLKSVDGKFGKAMEFDGEGYLEVDHSDKLEGMDVVTIEAWMKLNVSAGGGP